MAVNHVQGLRELEGQFRRLGTVPVRVIARAVRPSASIVLKEAKENAPKDEGELRRGLHIKAEKTKNKNKKVYQVRVRSLQHFVKISKEGKRAFYPSSQEYGFITRDGGYVPGYNYLRNALKSKQGEVSVKIIHSMMAEIEKI